MFLIILGIIIFGLAGTVTKNNVILAKYRIIGRVIGVLIVAIGILVSSVIQINAGEIGIKVLFGKVQNEVLGSGLHLINPLMEVRHVDVRTQNYTMSGIQDEGHQSSDDAIRVLT